MLANLGKAEGEVSDLGAELAKASRRLTLTSLTSPIDGMVQQLAIHTIGGVVTTAQALMVIVPDKGGLMVEAEVENKDVGFVHVGERTDVKIEAFTVTRYGLIEGTVRGLSRDVAIEPQQSQVEPVDDKEHQANAPKEAGYVARIKLDRDWIETETGRETLGPGMTVTAGSRPEGGGLSIICCRRSLKHVEESGHER